MSAARYGLGTFSYADGSPFPGLVVEDHVVDLRDAFGADATVLGLIEDWDTVEPRLSELAAAGAGSGPALSELRAHPPVRSRQIFCAGANYGRHVGEMAAAVGRKRFPDRSEAEIDEFVQGELKGLRDGDPFVFLGLPSALVGAADEIELVGPRSQHDWELELTVVIGRGGRDIPVGEAFSHVLGYTVANDVTTRDAVTRPVPPMTDFLVSKNRRTFKPVGPYIVPAGQVGDPTALQLTLKVNGEVMQDSLTDDLIQPIDKLIAYISAVAELYPGDMILTGSPSGNAAHHGGRWLVDGDVMDGEISGVGVIRNRCVAR